MSGIVPEGMADLRNLECFSFGTTRSSAICPSGEQIRTCDGWTALPTISLAPVLPDLCARGKLLKQKLSSYISKGEMPFSLPHLLKQSLKTFNRLQSPNNRIIDGRAFS